MRRSLSSAGRLFIDVNNRHNAAAYGRWRVFGRRVVDAICPDRCRGDTSFDWQIGDRKFPAMGHLFTPAEAHALVAEAGFRIVRFGVIDYSDGRRSTIPTAGQLVFCLGDIDE
jgi:hypothetical protein